MAVDSSWHTHRLALERWRDAYASYLASDPDFLDPLPDELADATPPAGAALRAAACDIASQDDTGAYMHGLELALPFIHRSQRRLSEAHRSGTLIRTGIFGGVAQHEADAEDSSHRFTTAEPREVAPGEAPPRPGPEGVLNTVERAIAGLRDCERR
jgi:hypothetical protein